MLVLSDRFWQQERRERSLNGCKFKRAFSEVGCRWNLRNAYNCFCAFVYATWGLVCWLIGNWIFQTATGTEKETKLTVVAPSIQGETEIVTHQPITGKTSDNNLEFCSFERVQLTEGVLKGGSEYPGSGGKLTGGRVKHGRALLCCGIQQWNWVFPFRMLWKRGLLSLLENNPKWSPQ